MLLGTPAAREGGGASQTKSEQPERAWLWSGGGKLQIVKSGKIPARSGDKNSVENRLTIKPVIVGCYVLTRHSNKGVDQGVVAVSLKDCVSARLRSLSVTSAKATNVCGTAKSIENGMV